MPSAQTSNPNLFFKARTDEETRLLDEQLNLKMLEDRDEGVKRIHEDMKYVNGMFKDIHSLVEDQGVAVDSIVKNIDKARKDVASGVKELQSASEAQQRRCCSCSIL